MNPFHNWAAICLGLGVFLHLAVRLGAKVLQDGAMSTASLLFLSALGAAYVFSFLLLLVAVICFVVGLVKKPAAPGEPEY